MIRVTVHINDREIIDLHAVRESAFYGMSKHHKYEVFITYGKRPFEDEHQSIGFINHKYSLGASRLSVRMLQMYYRLLDKRSQ